MTLRDSIETYVLAKDGNRPHLMQRAFAADAELVMDVKTDAISFPSTTHGLADISAVLVSRFALRYENIYTFCMSAPPDGATAFRCGWLVCMTEKESGAARVGFGFYDWSSDNPAGRITNLKITIEAMHVLASEYAGPVLDWASALPYPWCPPEALMRNLPDVPVCQAIAAQLARGC
jgi:hypothetical protein